MKSARQLWTGWVISAIAVLFLLFDGILHVLKPQPVVDSFAQLGFPLSLAVGLGVLELVCTVLYVFPHTAALGAILLTGYLGGATATQLRAGAEMFPLLFPGIIGLLVWGGLLLRDARLRALLL